MTSHSGAPRRNGRFTNPAGDPEMPGLGVTLPFFARRMWASLVPRPGAATRVPYDAAAMSRDPSLTWIGHSTFLVRMDGVTFLTDPMFSRRASPFSFMGPRRMVGPAMPLEELPAIDFVLQSHDHYDHLDRPTVEHLVHRGVRFVGPLGVGDWIRNLGGEAIELDWWQDIQLDGVRLHCVPAQHFSARTLWDRQQRLWCGWVVIGPSRRFYFAGDTGYASHFSEIGDRLGPFDLAALPIGAYLPQEIMHDVHVTPEEALRIARDVKAGRVAAMHFGTFDLTDEPIDEPPQRFRVEAERLGWGEDRAWIMKVGETRDW